MESAIKRIGANVRFSLFADVKVGSGLSSPGVNQDGAQNSKRICLRHISIARYLFRNTYNLRYLKLYICQVSLWPVIQSALS